MGRLNTAERADLSLLAQGHTAKSIANLTGRSVGAVNERLREARRKTGMGSSRELARMFAAQESRDEIVGVAQPGDRPDAIAAPERRRGVTRGFWIMLIPLPLLAAGIAVMMSSPDKAGTPPPASRRAESGQIDPRYWDAKYWHQRFAGEQRDAGWAPTAENALRAQMAVVPDLDGGDVPLSVRCATSVCEVRGVLSGDNARKSAMLDEVQDAAGKPIAGGPPLTVVSFSVEVPSDGRPVGFVAHFRRDYAPG